MPSPTSTYRLQVSPTFDLHAAAASCDYLATLGAGATYLSPLLPSARGSTHGYDVVAFDAIDNQRGSLDGWTRLLAAARARGLRVLVDIVPNHTGVADAHQNHAWWETLRLGPGSPYAKWFDIDWSSGRVLLPVLGDQFTPAELEVHDGELRYYDHRFPIAPETGLEAGGDAADVHERQHYQLVNFRQADTEQNYRRFFAVTSLAGLRVEDESVFAATHEQISRWVREDGIDGLRVDHPDGLTDPLGYLTRLRALAGPQAWITVEKILEPGEQLPANWPVDGTTGYDAMTEVGGLIIDPAAEAQLDRLYRKLTGDCADFAEHVKRGKRLAASTILRAEVFRLARLVPDIDRAAEALTELLVAFPVYRSYLPDGAEHLAAAIDAARSARPDLADSIARLASRLADPADELCARFQQTSGAVMAKGVEDTAYYRYTRFISLNEVGGNPAQFGLSTADFHSAQLRRHADASRSMTALSTHDTKRGEDVRARLAVLSELPEAWEKLVGGLMATAPIPNPTFAYLLWQTLAGVGFIARERLHDYVVKAMREAAVHTTWIEPNEEFEQTVHRTVDAAYDLPELHDPLARFIEQITPFGWSNSLSQKLVQLTMPGIPDVYQGTERWEDSLVDPDNRRSVDLDALQSMLDAMDGSLDPPPIDQTGRAKVWVTSRALRLRRDWPDLFDRYAPVEAVGPAAHHAIAYDRGGVIALATRLPVQLGRDGGWRDTRLDLSGAATDVITGRSFRGAVELGDLLSAYPVALLVR
ncbi:MAG: malto-oligosyltrehalose synthase [Actinomycetota bacterium]|nr:malto-oligosyltrehalose synthase [Actinomycetota bacterium]